MTKIQISNDTWNALLYDGNHSFVSKFGNDLVDLLDPKEGEKILDLGCGTGDLAKSLSDKRVKVIGVDKSENMIKQAKLKYPKIEFNVCDATELTYYEEFDAVFSNATLHWIKTPKIALECIFNSLKQNGRFIAEFGGKGNIKIIADEIIKTMKEFGYEFNMEIFPWYFPSIGEYTSLMEQIGFRVTFSHHFDRPTPLEGENGIKNWINMFASQMFTGITPEMKDLMISKVQLNLKEQLYKEDKWLADYKRIRVIGMKN
ncbi:methyltransferase domain-containing protein [Metabacillus litoralis]|uniref:Methyltransferase domain-containing protein n=1 Tax=Metabacillus litoralis TaxID=152268 RepID=A0A5C6W6H2_9BACI|nr:class I SAM-dependent methyltransferase [Metabacillus litoralis]TXC92994.1 methyltransferase domain-containing protein [Metabacillus litoralis]